MTQPRHRAALSQTEFVALMAMLAATVAFSIDAMLPALTNMGQELSPQAPDRAALVVTAFIGGMGLGTLFTGPLSDAYGRRPVMFWSSALFMSAAAYAMFAQSLEALLIARFVQGIGAAGPRIVAMAIIRDKYQGREMARLLSFVMIVFALVPVLAPTMGAGLIAIMGWRGIFGAFVVFSFLTKLWLYLRQPETLTADIQRPFRLGLIWDGLREMWAIPMVRLSILTQTCAFGMLFGMLSSVQLIYDQTFDAGHTFHLWFGFVALVSASSGALNASLVQRFGMRAIIMVMFMVSASLSLLLALIWPWLSPEWQFGTFVAWQILIFFQAGMTIGNLNALGLEPLGHIAGLAASVMGAIATLGAAIVAAPLGIAFDGTPVPLAWGLGLLAIACTAMTLRMRKLERVIVTAE
ncbi:MFS transporter [Primorskyibacter sp. S187A]|uniref:MFS transporter n=1 Tax=Primorskyibacter sp. S187A TaxID=3415130 RepID=UPI003C7E50CA